MMTKEKLAKILAEADKEDYEYVVYDIVNHCNINVDKQFAKELYYYEQLGKNNVKTVFRYKKTKG